MKVRWRPACLAIIFLVFFCEAALHEAEEKFMVYRARAESIEQLEAIKKLHDNMQEYELDFWLTPLALGDHMDVMIPSRRSEWLTTFLNQTSIPHFVSIPDVEKLIVEREQKKHSKPNPSRFSKRYHDEGGNKAKYGFGEYHSYAEMIEWMENIVRFYPDKAKMITIGTTHEGRPITGIKIGTNVQSNEKRVVWMDGGIHAREWAAIHTLLYFIERLIADYDTDPLVRVSVDTLNFYMFPVLNPDGFEYSRSGVSPMIRLWRKNRSDMVCKKDHWFRERCCGGVDLNRNFDWFWGEIGSSSDRCSEIYQGQAAFSELESKAVRNIMLSPELKGKVDGFITLHTYSQMWIHPFSHARKTVPEDIRELEQIGRNAVAALESVFGTKYRFGTGADILYPSSGGSDDWAKGKGGAKYVYLIELRPGEDVWDGFILDSRQLIPTSKETWTGIKVVIQAVLDRIARVKKQRLLRARVRRPPAPTIAKPITSTRRRFVIPSTTTQRPRGRASVVNVKNQRSNNKTTRFQEEKEVVRLVRPKLENRQRVLNPATVAPVTFAQQQFTSAVFRRPPQQSCFDRSPWCTAWLANNRNVCSVSSIYMRRDCARTCRFC